jgi:hypothetical protein
MTPVFRPAADRDGGVPHDLRSWVKAFNTKRYVPDDRGLFNPPGVKPGDETPRPGVDEKDRTTQACVPASPCSFCVCGCAPAVHAGRSQSLTALPQKPRMPV